MQGKRIERDVFVLPPPDIRVEGIVWKLHKVVYGLGDASGNWYFCVRDELIKLGCTQSKLDRKYATSNMLVYILNKCCLGKRTL